MTEGRKYSGCLFASLVFAFTGLSLASGDCKAGQPPSPYGSYEIIAGADDKYRLVMLKPAEPLYTDDGKAYPVSGLYKNDGSITPLWQVDWLEDSVWITSDGRYLAHVSSGWWGIYTDMAVTFYDRGKPIRQIRKSDFVKPSEEPKTDRGSHSWNLGVAFDDKRGLLRITTPRGEVRFYSMATGQLVEAPEQ